MLTWQPVVPGVWVAKYMTKTGIESNTVAVRYREGEIAVVSPPVGATDADYAATEALGRVAALVANNTGHDLGQETWQARYPDAVPYAPEVAGPKIVASKPKLRPFQPLSRLGECCGAGVRFVDVPGAKSGLTAFVVDAGDERAVFVDELLMNHESLPGPAPVRFVFWATGCGPGLARNKIWSLVFASDKKAAARAVLAELDARPPTVVVPAHGAPIRDVARARALLAEIA